MTPKIEKTVNFPFFRYLYNFCQIFDTLASLEKLKRSTSKEFVFQEASLKKNKSICVEKNASISDQNRQKFQKKISFLEFPRTFCLYFDKLGGLVGRRRSPKNHNPVGSFWEINAVFYEKKVHIETKNDKTPKDQFFKILCNVCQFFEKFLGSER